MEPVRRVEERFGRPFTEGTSDMVTPEAFLGGVRLCPASGIRRDEQYWHRVACPGRSTRRGRQDV